MSADIFNGDGWVTIFNPGSDGPYSITVDNPPILAEMQAWVGGYVELVSHFKHAIRHIPMQVYVNEEGRIRGLPNNIAGTAWLIQNGVWVDGGIVGPIVVLTGERAVWR